MSLRVAPEPFIGPPVPVWNEGATNVDAYRAEFEMARIMEDAALAARRVLLHAGARVTHATARDLDWLASEWAARRDHANRALNGEALTRALIRLCGGEPDP